MQSTYETRRLNLRALMREWGGPTTLAKKLGHANGSYLAQIAGPNPSREISEKVAREVEHALGLPLGWMDQEHAGGTRVDDAALGDCVRAVAAALRDENKRPDPEKYGALVSLAYDYMRLTGRVDEAHIKKLVRLI